MVPTSREFFYVLIPIISNLGIFALFILAGAEAVTLVWTIYLAVAVVIFAAASGFLAYFEDRIRNGYAWGGIFLNGAVGILVFAAVYKVGGVVCAAPVCLEAETVVIADLGLIAPENQTNLLLNETPAAETVKVYTDFPTAVYFATVTFTTLGYGDLQPVPAMRLLAGIEAMIGYIYLGFLVGAAFHWASHNDQETVFSWKTLKVRVSNRVKGRND